MSLGHGGLVLGWCSPAKSNARRVMACGWPRRLTEGRRGMGGAFQGPHFWPLGISFAVLDPGHFRTKNGSPGRAHTALSRHVGCPDPRPGRPRGGPPHCPPPHPRRRPPSRRTCTRSRGSTGPTCPPPRMLHHPPTAEVGTRRCLPAPGAFGLPFSFPLI